MGNLIEFLLRFHTFFLFILLEVIALALLVTFNDNQNQLFISSSNSVSGSVFNMYDGVTSYMSLAEENRKLQRENAELKGRNKNSLYFHEILKKEELDSIFENKLAQQQFDYLPARIINNSISRSSNYITINKGTRHNVKPNSGVITSNGVVGIVLKASSNYSVVMSMLHRDTRVSAKLSKSKHFGSLVWNGKDYRLMDLKAIPKHAPVMKGDSITTSGFSTIFPQNIPIGTVENVEHEEGDNFHNIKVKLSTDLKSTEYVYVVQNRMKAEQKNLEKEVKGE